MTLHNIIMDGHEYVMIPLSQWADIAVKIKAAGDTAALVPPPPLADGSYTPQHARIALCNKVARQRKAAGLTQAQLAKLAGIRVETISRLENGLHMPSTPTFAKIDRAIQRANKKKAA